MDTKPNTVKWEVSNFSPGRTFDTARCIKDRLGGFLVEDINRRSMVASRTDTSYKYTRTEGSKICDTYILQIQKGSSSAVQIDSQPALAYLVKMGGARNLPMIQEAKEIWEFCSVNQITLTAEYLPETLNTRADKASREMNKSSSEWILNKPIFKKMIQALGPVDKDMFASRLCHQIPKYISWQPDPHAWMVDAF